MAKSKFVSFILFLLLSIFVTGIASFGVWYFVIKPNNQVIEKNDSTEGNTLPDQDPNYGNQSPNSSNIPEITIESTKIINEGETLIISPMFASYPNVDSSNMNYNWQKFNPSSNSWENIPDQMNREFTQSNIQISKYNDVVVRLLVTLKTTGDQRSSNSCTITVTRSQEYINSVNISAKSIVLQEGSNIEITSSVDTNIDSSDLNYEWLESSDGGSTYQSTGIYGPTFSKVSTINDNSKLFKLKVSKKNTSIVALIKESNSVFITINEKETEIIIDQNIATSMRINEDDNLNLEVIAHSNKEYDPISYQWEYKNSISDTTWKNLDGETSSTLNKLNVPYSWNGYVLRLRMSTTNDTNTTYSNECILSISPLIPNVSIIDNTFSNYTINLYDGQELPVISPEIIFNNEKFEQSSTYQWYYYNYDIGNFMPIINQNKPELNYGKVSLSNNTLILKLIVTVNYQETMQKEFESQEYRVFVERNKPNLGKDSILIKPSKDVYYVNENVTIQATIPTINNLLDTDVITYKWQYRYKANDIWSDLQNTNILNYSFRASMDDNDKIYRLELSVKPINGYETLFYSKELNVNIKENLAYFDKNPTIADTINLNQGNDLELSKPDFNIANNSSTPIIEWEYKKNSNSQVYLPINNLLNTVENIFISESQEKVIIRGDIYQLNGYYFRAKVSVSNVFEYSNDCEIIIERNPITLDHILYEFNNLSVSDNSFLEINVTSIDISNLRSDDVVIYQWQVLKDGETSWKNIVNQNQKNLYIPSVDSSWSNAKVRLTMKVVGVTNYLSTNDYVLIKIV